MFLRRKSFRPFLAQAAAAVMIAIALHLAATGPARAEPRQYVIDPEHFSIAIKVMHIGYADMIGLFVEGEGAFTFDEETLALSDVKVTIKTASFTTGHQKRDDHVRSADFLN
ncbi:MAG: YceI family protein, partial [Alphaproteobacteria bacterium]|nr:YceI family protein [Alphaproteobacteria bacterium]